MAWYDVGSISVTNGSTTVTGSGTDFISGVQVGEGLYIGGDLYEIATIVSGTELTLADAYLGSTATGQDYKIIPTQSLVADLSSGVADLISDFADVRDYAGSGKFNDGSVSSPAITFTQDQNNGLYRIGSDNWGLVAGGEKIVDVSTNGIKLDDNNKATFGTGNDLQIYHDGNDSYIDDAGQGSLAIRGGASVSLQNYAGGVMVKGNAGGSTDVYHNNSKKLATTATGVDVTGTVTADGLTVDGTSVSPLTITSTNNGAQISYSSANSSVPWYTGVSGDTSENFVIYQSGSGTAGIELYTDGDKRLNIANNGNVSFYEDTGTTAKMVWSSSAESLGIGTSSPQTPIEISGPKNTSTIRLRSTTNDASWSGGDYFGRLEFWSNDSSAAGGGVKGSITTASTGGGGGTAYMAFNVASTATNDIERMRIDSLGNVGIGTDSPSSKLDVNGTVTADAVEVSTASGVTATSGGGTARMIGAGAGTYFGSATNTPVIFQVNQNEKARLDSSGNFMVDTTSNPVSSSSVKGLWYDATANYLAVSNDNVTAYFNRQGSDGIITQFRKDGSSVGSIGVDYGTEFYVGGTQSSGLYFSNTSLRPTSGGDANTLIDDTIVLGSAAHRFKDLYLSGGVHLGGTGSANKLDDYETGDFTPTTDSGTITYSDAVYTKIGRVVTITIESIEFSDTTTSQTLKINSLPFTSSVASVGSVMVSNVNTPEDWDVCYVPANQSYINFYANKSLGFSSIKRPDLKASNSIYLQITYETDS